MASIFIDDYFRLDRALLIPSNSTARTADAPRLQAMSKIGSTEKTKLLANWMNAVSVAVFGAGGLLPLLSVYVGVGPPVREPDLVWQIFAFCLVVALGLHWFGSLILGRLSDG